MAFSSVSATRGILMNEEQLCEHYSSIFTTNNEGEKIEFCPECGYSAVELPDGSWKEIS
jgi:hypothetical protein